MIKLNRALKNQSSKILHVHAYSRRVLTVSVRMTDREKHPVVAPKFRYCSGLCNMRNKQKRKDT